MNVTCFSFTPPLPGHAAWAASPNCRGTYDIVTLCLSTITICIWTSIHWDIPLKRLSAELDGKRWWTRWTTITCRFFKQRGPLVIIAIFFPALLLFRAVNQLFEAWRMVNPRAGYIDNWSIRQVMRSLKRQCRSALDTISTVIFKSYHLKEVRNDRILLCLIAHSAHNNHSGFQRKASGSEKAKDSDIEAQQYVDPQVSYFLLLRCPVLAELTHDGCQEKTLVQKEDDHADAEHSYGRQVSYWFTLNRSYIYGKSDIAIFRRNSQARSKAML